LIYLVTDSTACLSRQDVRELGLLVVPCHYFRDGREAFQEGFVEDWRPEPDADLSRYTTAQAPSPAFLELFQRLKRQGHQALCLTLSSRLSGTYANALKAAEEAGEGFMVVDSRSTAGAMYLLLREARGMIDRGDTLAACFERLKALRRNTRTIFTIQDMDPLRRSGRLGFMRSSVSTLLNLRPLLALQDGSVVSHSLARGRQDQLRQMVLGLSGKPKEVVVQYQGGEDAAEELARRLKEKGIEVVMRPIGVILSIHLGLPLLSMAWIEAEEPARAAL